MAQSKEYQRAWYEANKERKLAQSKAWREANPEKCQQYATTEKRKEQKRVYGRTHKRKNPQKPPPTEKAREYVQRWAKRNPEKIRAIWAHHANKRKAIKIRARPQWTDDGKVAALYAVAVAYRRAGFDVHVDHIVPLRSRLVCGLHTEANLQLLFGPDNARKSNKDWPDRP